MPRSQNDESFVSDRSDRVFAPVSAESARVCPHCEDELRDGARVRAARSTRH